MMIIRIGELGLCRDWAEEVRRWFPVAHGTAELQPARTYDPSGVDHARTRSPVVTPSTTSYIQGYPPCDSSISAVELCVCRLSSPSLNAAHHIQQIC